MSLPERWLPIPGYEGHYEVSDIGRIRSLDRYVSHARSGKQFVRGKVLAVPLDTHGYPRVVLSIDGRFKSWAVHRAMLAAFEPRADWRQMHVNHKDGKTQNNHLGNIEWCTASENRLHSYRVLKTNNPQLGKKGVLSPLSKPVVGVRIDGGERKHYRATTDVLVDGFKPSDVLGCVGGRQKSHKGWMWFKPHEAPAEAKYTPGTTAGAENGCAHAVVCIAPDGTEKRYEYARAAVADGFSECCISHVLTGRQKTHRGCLWRLANA